MIEWQEALIRQLENPNVIKYDNLEAIANSSDHEQMTHAVEANNVSIVKGSFDPAVTESYTPSAIKIAKGTTVTWKNDDTVIHTVTDAATEGEVKFDSGLIQAGVEWTHTFDNGGEYDYYCMLHPWMRGAVYVE